MGDVMSLDKLDKVKADTEEIKTLIEGIDGDVTIINDTVGALENVASGIVKTTERPYETFVAGATSATSFAEKVNVTGRGYLKYAIAQSVRTNYSISMNVYIDGKKLGFEAPEDYSAGFLSKRELAGYADSSRLILKNAMAVKCSESINLSGDSASTAENPVLSREDILNGKTGIKTIVTCEDYIVFENSLKIEVKAVGSGSHYYACEYGLLD